MLNKVEYDNGGWDEMDYYAVLIRMKNGVAMRVCDVTYILPTIVPSLPIMY
jgi:hypothetical protein